MLWLFSGHLSPMGSVGVVQLRLTLSAYLICVGITAAGQMAEGTMWMWWQVGMPSLLAAVLVLLGALTALALGIVVLSQIAYLIGHLSVDKTALAVSTFAPAFAISIAIGLALLGPGRYSIDAHLFGRREIRIPRHPHRPAK